MIDLYVTHALAFLAGALIYDAIGGWIVLRGWPPAVDFPRARITRRQRRNLLAMKADIKTALRRKGWTEVQR